MHGLVSLAKTKQLTHLNSCLLIFTDRLTTPTFSIDRLTKRTYEIFCRKIQPYRHRCEKEQMRKKEHGVTKRASRSVADGAERVRLITWQVYLMAMNAQHIHGCWATLDRMDSPLCSDRCFLNTHQAAVACIYLTERGRERMGKSSQRVGRPERPP
jgi:hypothetical protein